MHDAAHPVVEPYLTSLEVSKAIAAHRNLSNLFHELLSWRTRAPYSSTRSARGDGHGRAAPHTPGDA